MLLISMLALSFSYFVAADMRKGEELTGARAENVALLETIAEKEREIDMLHIEAMLLAEALDRSDASLAAREAENADLVHRLGIAVTEKDILEKSVNEIGEKIGIIEKLTSLDEELLQKYSKVYFLSENYSPADLATVTPALLLEEDREQYVHAGILPHLTRMMADAALNETPLRIVSAYRSFGEQSALKNAYTVTYGSGANKFSADQGYSEHQLGTTVDFTTPLLGSAFTEFDETKAYQWLLGNAWKYGFVLSYPEGNAYYMYEPWHWRYVGVVLSVRLHQEGKSFYDLDQREINRHLIDLF